DRCAGSVTSTGARGSGVNAARSASSSSTSCAHGSSSGASSADAAPGADPPGGAGPPAAAPVATRPPGGAGPPAAAPVAARTRVAPSSRTARRSPSGSAGHTALTASTAVGLVAPWSGGGAHSSTTPAPARQAARTSVRNGDGPRGFFVPSPHQYPEHSSRRR